MPLGKIVTKIYSSYRNKIKNKTDSLESRLMSPFTELAEDSTEDSGAPTCHNMKMTDQFSDSNIHESNEEKILSILEDVLMGEMEPTDAAKQLKQVCIHHSQELLNKFIGMVKMFLDNNFPTMYNEHQINTCEYLNDPTNLMLVKIISIVPVLKDTGLLKHLLCGYNHRIISMLDLLLDKSSSVKDIHFLLLWVMETYLRQQNKGCSDIEDGIFQVPDIFLLTSLAAKLKWKYLKCTQNEVTTVLHNILMAEENDDCDITSEEDFIKVQLDITQCLAAHIQTSTTVSQILGKEIKAICCEELHIFAQRYMDIENKRLKAKKPKESDLLPLFRIIYTCRSLHSYAKSITNQINETDSSLIQMLLDMANQALSKAQMCVMSISEEHLKKYFKNEGHQFYKLKETLQKYLKMLPDCDQLGYIKKDIVSALNQSVCTVYLRCLLQRKYKHLKNRWNNVEIRLMQDAKDLHEVFTLTGISEAENEECKQKMLLFKICQVLECRHVDSLKLCCSYMYRHFFKESEEFLSSLLHWTGELSKQTIKEALNVSLEVYLNEGPDRRHGLKPWCHWLCCG